jgi:hypothetical protein
MRYLDAYKHISKSPHWMLNILIGLASSFVPIAGPMVFAGYLLESMEVMLRTGEEKPTDFDVNRLVPYFFRGLWPFLVGLVVSIPLTLLMACCGGVSALVGLVVGGAGGLVVGYLLAFFGIMVFAFLISLVSLPMKLRAGRTLDFGLAFDLAFVKDFFRRVGKEVVLTELFIMVSSLVLVFAGLLACCVGVYFVLPVVQFAGCHLGYQLLKLYQERGGQPIPFKPYESDRPYEDRPPRPRDERFSPPPEDRPPPPEGGFSTGPREGFPPSS